MLLRYLHWRLPFGFPCQEGGTNVVDVDDCAEGHVLAMDRGAVGERYILGGENLTYRQILELLAEITGLPGPGFDTPRALAMALGCVLQTKARLFGGEPLITYRLARDLIGSFTWVTSHRAEQLLGYHHRSARRTLMRSVRYYLEHGFVTPAAARRIRLDLRAIA
jgi:dihydroflavonol-4-reductase